MWRIGFVLAAIGVVSILSYSQIPYPDTLIVATPGDLETLDPAWAYDTASRCGHLQHL
jgi:ABC-type transport system substrate-binding protein